ncbi:MAG: FG-GAP repeat protein [Nannocystis sp.]|nr:FG-GAP repeat protein [Nannocystis sp.]
MRDREISLSGSFLVRFWFNFQAGSEKRLSSSEFRISSPLIADIDSDGHADIVVSSNNYSGFNCGGQKTTGVRVFSAPRWTRTRKLWNQHAYSVTNIDNDGNVPATPVNNWTQPGLNNFRQNYIEDVSPRSALVRLSELSEAQEAASWSAPPRPESRRSNRCAYP